MASRARPWRRLPPIVPYSVSIFISRPISETFATLLIALQVRLLELCGRMVVGLILLRRRPGLILLGVSRRRRFGLLRAALALNIQSATGSRGKRRGKTTSMAAYSKAGWTAVHVAQHLPPDSLHQIHFLTFSLCSPPSTQRKRVPNSVSTTKLQKDSCFGCPSRRRYRPDIPKPSCHRL